VQKKLIVITGPTASGKSDLAVEVAVRLNAEIISADSRQMYKGLKIGTAAPGEDLLSRVPHHFIAFLNVDQYYNVKTYEDNAIKKINQLLEINDFVVLTGGSMLYVNAILNGIDEIPDIDPEIRKMLTNQFEKHGLDNMKIQLQLLDPLIYGRIDVRNPARVIHALEVCLSSGLPYSSFLNHKTAIRPFKIIHFNIELPRPLLFSRINTRVDKMIQAGLLDEVKFYWEQRDLNALNGVGYKELFLYLSGVYDFEQAVDKIKVNTRRYAKKQMTWFNKYQTIPVDESTSLDYIIDKCFG